MAALYTRLKRYREIITVFLKYGLNEVLLFVSEDIRKRLGKVKAGQPRANLFVNIRKAFEALGPTFIKFGQFLSTKEEWLPSGLIREFALLQDSVSPLPFAEVAAVVPEEHFAELEREPIASASLSQVYRGRLRNGKQVAVKVKRPGIETLIKVDFEILAEIAAFLQYYRVIPEYIRIMDVIEEFRRAIDSELHFTNEVRNLLRFYDFFKDDPNVIIPFCYEEYSDDDIIVMDYIAGKKIDEALAEGSADRKSVAETLLEATFKQIFVFSYFHADPHPANLFIVERDKVALLDFGLVGYIDTELRENIKEMILGVYSQNYRQVLKALLRMDVLPEDIDLNAFRRDIEFLLQKYRNIQVGKVRVGQLVGDLRSIVHRYRLRIPRQLVLMMRAVGLVEGTALKAFPDVNMEAIIRKYGRYLIQEEFSLKTRYKRLMSFLAEFGELIRAMPENIDMILWKIRKGELRVKFDLTEMKDMINSLERMTNRLVLGFILAALIIASGLFLKVNIGPKILGLPLLGLTSLILSVILIIILFVSIIKSRFR